MREIKLPFYAKISLIMLSFILILTIIYVGQGILIPLAFALLLSVLVLPLCRFLERHKIPRMFAIAICILCSFIFFALVVYFISSQLMSLTDAAPDMKGKFTGHVHDIQIWLQSTFGISNSKQTQWLDQKLNELYASSGTYIGTTLNAVSNTFIFIALVPVYMILFLYYRDHFSECIAQIFGNKETKRVSDIMHETRVTIQSYIVGLLIEGFCVAVLNCTGLLLAGLQYGILIGVIAAILNVVPYIGGIIAILLAVAMAIITHDSFTYPLLITAILLLVQFIDNHVLIPRIVASRVKLNALVSIVVVLIGGALCGVWGMFLSIPVTAVLKLIFDRIEELKPWGHLLGNGDRHLKRVSIKIGKNVRP